MTDKIVTIIKLTKLSIINKINFFLCIYKMLQISKEEYKKIQN